MKTFNEKTFRMALNKDIFKRDHDIDSVVFCGASYRDFRNPNLEVSYWYIPHMILEIVNDRSILGKAGVIQ